MENVEKMHELALRAYSDILLLRNYSENTAKNYRACFIHFLRHFKKYRPSSISKSEIIDYLSASVKEQNWSATYQNMNINAIKFFYEKVLNRQGEMYELPRARKEWKLPAIFAEEEVRSILMAVDNIKHLCMLCLAYAGGLRVSEIVRLRCADIDSKRMVITIRQAKGRKDRQVMLSEKLLNMLREYYKKYRPSTFLFEGQTGGRYSKRSIQKVLELAKRRAGIHKRGSMHAFRHSFATHLLEGGTDIFSIKELLGHSSIKTTAIYTNVSRVHLQKIRSPFDKLNF